MLKKTLLVGAAALPVLVGAVGTPSAKGYLDELNVGTFSANVGIFSDYVFRGISQTINGPALQGGIDWAHDLGEFGNDTGIGLYAGAWGSNVSFAGGLELDVYGGIAGELPLGPLAQIPYLESVYYDLGALYYVYPGSAPGSQFNYFEALASLGADFGLFSLTGTAFYSPDFFGGTDEGIYVEGVLEVPLPHGFTANGTFGYQMVDNNVKLGISDYKTWGAGLAFDLATLHSNFDGLSASFQYSETDLGCMSLAGFAGAGVICDETFTFGIAAELGGPNS